MKSNIYTILNIFTFKYNKTKIEAALEKEEEEEEAGHHWDCKVN